MPRVGKYPSGIRQRSKGNWEYRHSWSAVEVDQLYRKYGHLLPDQPPNFWKPGQWVEAYASTERDIRNARDRIRAGITLGTYVPRKIAQHLAKDEAAHKEEQERAAGVLFSDVAEEYFAFLRRHGTTDGTIRTYRSHYRQGMKDLHATPIVQLTADELEAWLEVMRDDHGSDYVYRVYSSLKRIFKYASGQDPRQHRNFKRYINEDPCILYGGKKPASREGRVLTLEEVKALANAMPEHRRAFIWLGALGGLRLGESLGLQRQHVSIENGRVWLSIEQQLVRAEKGPAYIDKTKTEAGRRRIPLMTWGDIDPVPLFEQWLTEHIEESPEAHIVPLRSGQSFCVSHTQITLDFRLARERAGEEFGGVVSHDLRHTALTTLGRRGATTADLMRFGGHTDPKVVAIYQHSDAQSLARLAGGAQ